MYSEKAEFVAAMRILKKDDEGKLMESINDMFHRVANFLGSSEEEKREFYNSMASLDFLPNSPCLVNAGLSSKPANLSACFVLGIDDSIKDIYAVLAETAEVHRSGGGTGFNFSALRPKDSIVSSTKGVASGPVSFMRLYDASTEAIKQGGVRRGANIGILAIDHPDIEEFIECKKGTGELKNFNISVAITDDFMDAVFHDKSFDLRFGGKKYKSLPARALWDKITTNAHLSGDPGILFLDRINKANPLQHPKYRIQATNPCQPGWTPVRNKYGITSLAELKVGEKIWSCEGWTNVIRKEATGIKQVYAYETTAGTFYSTENHKVIQNDKKLEVQDATALDTIQCEATRVTNHDKLDVIDGLVIGDGTYHKSTDNVLLCIGENDQDYFDSFIASYIGPSYCRDDKYKIITTITPEEIPYTYERTIPYRFMYATKKTIAGFLSGLYSANGSVLRAHNRITLKASSQILATQVQVLLSALGIRSYITTNKETECTFANGTYTSKQNYSVNVTTSRREFKNSIIFLQKYKQEALEFICDQPIGRVKSTFDILRSYKVRDEEVYNITVDNASHTYWSFGFNTGNCGEVPLSNNEACCLGSVNWSNMLDASGEIDYNRLRETTAIGVRILNAIIDKSGYPNEAIKSKVLLSRKIGVGVMGIADFFIKLKIVYGSDESLELVEDMCSIMLDSCVKTSHEYPASFDAFEHYVPQPHIKESLKRLNMAPEDYRPANATLMTIAPTGTLSMLADCSSGIEPVFFFESTENRVGESRTYLHPLYASFKAEHPRLRVPAYFIESHSVEIDSHIQMQATFQRYVCNAVSKTINLPKTATVEDIDKVYKEAYMLGCKGVTAYVDGSLEMQTIEGSGTYAKKSGFITPLERPTTLTGSTHEIKTGFGPLYVTVNYSDGSPFEVLCNIGKSGASENAKAESVGKLISLALRCGISLEHIIEQIEGIVGSKSQYSEYGLVTSIPDAIAKILTTKVLDGATVTRTVGMQTCVDCNSTELHYEGSCLVCSSCGWKSCGN